MRDGAYDFITKPLKRHSLVKAVQKALEKQALVADRPDLALAAEEYQIDLACLCSPAAH